MHEAGLFMWAGHADAVVDGWTSTRGTGGLNGPPHVLSRLDAALCHAREVILDGTGPRITVTDTLTGSRGHQLRMSWHLGPEVTAELVGAVADLRWAGRDGQPRQAHLALPVALQWSAHRGETQPPLGWYSPRLGARVPATTLVGVGEWSGTIDLRTDLATAFLHHGGIGRPDRPFRGRWPRAHLADAMTEQVVDLGSTWAVLRRRRVAIIAAALLGGLAGAGLLVLSPPAYLSTSVVLLPEATQAGSGKTGGYDADTQVLIATSAEILLRAAQQVQPELTRPRSPTGCPLRRRHPRF